MIDHVAAGKITLACQETPVPGGDGANAGRARAANADGRARGEPGIISGNVIQVPVQVPINTCGNTIDIVGLLNPTFGNTCVNP